MKNCDLFVYLDTVQFSKNSFDNRNRIPKKDGTDWWLTIPIKNSGKFGQTYLECYPNDILWAKSHLGILKQAYKGSPYFDQYFVPLETYYETIFEKDNLADINFHLLRFFLRAFDIKTPIVRASQKRFIGKGSDLVLDVCRQLGATEYYSGKMGKDYLKTEDFEKSNIKVTFQTYEPPHMWSAVHQLFINGGVL